MIRDVLSGMWIRLFANIANSMLAWVLVVCVSSLLQGCRRDHGESVAWWGSSQSVLAATADHNGREGQVARCERIYRNRPMHACTAVRTPACSGLFQVSCVGSLGKPGIKEASEVILRKALEPRSMINEDAVLVARDTRQMLLNMMRDPHRPVHPAAFFATIKDYETGANLFQWGKDQFQCRTPAKCSKKCVPKEDCERWCKRHGPLMKGEQACLHECDRKGYVCDNSCLGLFQVDPESDNFEAVSGSSDRPFQAMLWEESHIRWDMSKVCGKNGLDILGLEGGPDFCALLYWLTRSSNGTKCTFFINQQRRDGSYINPCRDDEFRWSVATFFDGHRAYGQYQTREDAWPRKYQGFVSKDGDAVLGYEHCAAHGYEGYHYSQAQSLDIPTAALRASVLDYGCRIGVVPPWARAADCPQDSSSR